MCTEQNRDELCGEYTRIIEQIFITQFRNINQRSHLQQPILFTLRALERTTITPTIMNRTELKLLIIWLYSHNRMQEDVLQGVYRLRTPG